MDGTSAIRPKSAVCSPYGFEAAQRALAETRAGIEEIASRSGFGSAEVLRRTFLRVLHATPSEWRARFGSQAPRAIGVS